MVLARDECRQAVEHICVHNKPGPVSKTCKNWTDMGRCNMFSEYSMMGFTMCDRRCYTLQGIAITYRRLAIVTCLIVRAKSTIGLLVVSVMRGKKSLQTKCGRKSEHWAVCTEAPRLSRLSLKE